MGLSNTNQTGPMIDYPPDNREHEARQSAVNAAVAAARSGINDAATEAREQVRVSAAEAKRALHDAAQEASIVLRINQAGQESRLAQLERAMDKFALVLDRFSTMDSLIAHNRTMGEDHEDRVRVIEKELPVLRLIRAWVIAGVVGLWGLLGTALFAIVTKFFGLFGGF